MSMIIAFAHTTPALLAGAKTVTRRKWTPRHAAHFHAGDIVQAWSKSPRVRGADIVAHVKLTADPYVEDMVMAPDSDYYAEGFGWLYAHPEHVPLASAALPHGLDEFSHAGYDRWRLTGGLMYVVRFEVVQELILLESRRQYGL